MSIFYTLQQFLGPVAIPLMGCALLAAMILIERLLMLGYHTAKRTLSHGGLALLKSHKEQPKALREEILALWLVGQKQKLASGLRLLQIVALVAPLLGLLGTVIGLIQVFDTIGLHRGPIEPSMLAGGLGIAMKTTAAGLIIAVPAVLGVQGYQLWVDKLVSVAEHQINVNNLKIDGVGTEVWA